jgi:class 3 adenylate cyclase
MFDGPQRAIRCAMAIRDAVQALGIQVRAGLHTGEREVRGDDIGGLAVHIGARVSALAAPNDVLVSSTLRDLVIGSGLEFEDRGAHMLKGVPGEWHLVAVASPVAVTWDGRTVVGRWSAARVCTGIRRGLPVR